MSSLWASEAQVGIKSPTSENSSSEHQLLSHPDLVDILRVMWGSTLGPKVKTREMNKAKGAENGKQLRLQFSNEPW